MAIAKTFCGLIMDAEPILSSVIHQDLLLCVPQCPASAGTTYLNRVNREQESKSRKLPFCLVCRTLNVHFLTDYQKITMEWLAYMVITTMPSGWIMVAGPILAFAI